nr:carboxypeptidase-like regulatory domain-containing protein [Treponemataceae bacterium]
MKKSKLQKWITILTVILIAAMFIGCENQPEIPLTTDPTTNTQNSPASENEQTPGTQQIIEKGQILGYVEDTKGEPVSGASVVLGSKTTTTNENGHFILKDIPINDRKNEKYIVTIKKEGYLSTTANNISVYETTNNSDAAKVLDQMRIDCEKILEEYAKNTSSGAANAGVTAISPDGTVLMSKDDDDTLKPIADEYAKLYEAYTKIEKTFEATFIQATLTPLNSAVEGTVNITTSSKGNETVTDSNACEGITVKITYKTSGENYVQEAKAKTDASGKFKIENLPANKNLSILIDGFEKTIDGKTYYFSSDKMDWLAENNYSSVNTDTFKIEEKSGTTKSLSILLYAQPTKIIVEETNLLKKTINEPLELNTPITFKFNKPMEYISISSEAVNGIAAIDDTETKVTYTSDTAKTTWTVTPKDSYWTGSSNLVNFKLYGKAEDGSQEFINGSWNVYIDNIINVTYQNTTTSTQDAFTLTFNHEIDTPSVKVTDNPNEPVVLTWAPWDADTGHVLTVAARDNQFQKDGEHVFTITGLKAFDGSTEITSYAKEFDSSTKTFKIRFNGFKPTGIEVVESKGTAVLARSVIAPTDKYLKITFNKNVKDVSGLSVTEKIGTGNPTTVSCSKYIKDNEVYISLENFHNGYSLGLSGSVISADNSTFNGSGDIKWADLINDYIIETAYVIAASNLYESKVSINSNNDNTINKIKAGDPITLTFNKEFPAGTVFETEFYEDAATLEKLDETLFRANVSADGKVLTITLDSSGRQLKDNSKYWMSLKAKKSDGTLLFSTANPSAGTGTTRDGLYIEPEIIKPFGDSGKKYICIETLPKETVKLKTDELSQTTTSEEFANSEDGEIVLEFDKDVKDYTVVLFNYAEQPDAQPPIIYPASLNSFTYSDEFKQFNKLKKTDTGNIITIKAAADGILGRGETNVYPAVYDADGNRVQLADLREYKTRPLSNDEFIEAVKEFDNI